MDKAALNIYNAILETPGMNEREIAERVGLKKTPYTRWILLSLISSGHIARFWDETRSRKSYVYVVQETQPL